MTMPKPPPGFEFEESVISDGPTPPPGFESVESAFYEDIATGKRPVAPGLSKKGGLGLLRGLGKIAEEIGGGGLKDISRIQSEAKGFEEETKEEEIQRKGGETAGEFLGSFAVPLGPITKGVKGLIPKKGEKVFFDFLKKHGFSDKEITPFLQSDKKWSFLKNLAKKDKKTANLLQNIHEKFGGVYEPLIKRGSAERGLKRFEIDSFAFELYKKLKKIPLVHREGVIKDVRELGNSKINNADFIQFIQNINARIGTAKGGKRSIGLLKEPVKTFMKKLNPQLAEDYDLANKLYGKSKSMARNLAPKQIDEFVEAGEVFGIASGIATGNFGLLTKIMGITGARTIAREMLINPKLQRMANKIITNISTGNKKNVAKIMHQISKEFKKDHPEISDQLDK